MYSFLSYISPNILFVININHSWYIVMHFIPFAFAFHFVSTEFSFQLVGSILLNFHLIPFQYYIWYIALQLIWFHLPWFANAIARCNEVFCINRTFISFHLLNITFDTLHLIPYPSVCPCNCTLLWSFLYL